MARYTYIVPGILTAMENPRTWDYQAQAWLYERDYGMAGGFNYHAGVIGGNISRENFSEKVGNDLAGLASVGFEPIDVAAHSNGCAIVLKAILKANQKIRRLHLIAAAVNQDCSLNGLNAIAEHQLVDRVLLYVSPDDEVLANSGLAGYGELGKNGPMNIRPTLSGILQIVTEHCGHCDWIGRDFEKTMRRIAGADIPDALAPN